MQPYLRDVNLNEYQRLDFRHIHNLTNTLVDHQELNHTVDMDSEDPINSGI